MSIRFDREASGRVPWSGRTVYQRTSLDSGKAAHYGRHPSGWDHLFGASCGRQSVVWIAEVWKWTLKRPRFCWSRAGYLFSTRGSSPENMRFSGKQVSCTWGSSWIEGLASTNTCRSQLPEPSNVEQAWLGSCPTLVYPGKQREDWWWRAWCIRSCFVHLRSGLGPYKTMLSREDCSQRREVLLWE